MQASGNPGDPYAWFALDDEIDLRPPQPCCHRLIQDALFCTAQRIKPVLKPLPDAFQGDTSCVTVPLCCAI